MKKQVYVVLCALVLAQILILPASAVTIDPVEITILDNGNAIVDLHYSMNLLEKALLRDEFEIIQSKFSNWLEKDVMIRNYDEESGYISLGIFDFVNEKIDFQDGYWINYVGVQSGKETLFYIINIEYEIGRAEVFFPDGYVRVYEGSVPSDVHFVNHELTSYWYNSQYYQKVYAKSYGVYDTNNYNSKEYIKKVAKYWGDDLGFNNLVLSAGLGTILVSSLPPDVQALSTLSSLSDATVGVLNKPAGLTQVMDASAVSYYLKDEFEKYPQITSNMKKMSELKAEEALLLEALLSESGKKWSENLDLLIANLNTQKEILNKLKKDTNEMMVDVQWTKDNGMFISIRDESVPYIISLAEVAVQVTENDLTNVEGQLRYLKTYPISSPSPTTKEEKVKILSHNGYVDYLYGCFKAVGEVQNGVKSNIEQVKVTATFYDSQYNVIDTGSSTTEIRILKPEQKSPFEIFCSDKTKKPSSYKLSVSYSETENEPFEGLEILRHSSSKTTKEGFHEIVGEVKNKGMTDAKSVRVIVTYYDISDDVIGIASSYTTPSDIASGATAPFEIPATPMKVRHARYELQVLGT